MSSDEDPVNESRSMDSSDTDEEIFDKESDNSGANYLNADCLEVKLEIEGKEEAGEFSNETDFNGHLQFVSFDPQVPTECNSISSGTPEWNYAQNHLPSTSEIQDATVTEQNEQSNLMHVYEQLANVPCDITKEMFIKQESTESNSASTLPAIYGSSNSSWTNEAYISSQYDVPVKSIPKKRSRASSAEAVKKRQYRKKMKEDNPDMWAAIKRLEACKKREQREEKRLILFEMEKTKALISDCDASELERHIGHLQELKDKYPDLWLQLETDRPSADGIYLSNSQEKSVSLKMRWRSLTEAEKKRYYRKKIKEENPELWSAIKLKDACKKREQREEKRHILLEMQKTMELISHSDPKEAEDHKANLEALKDKYPELWLQLEDAITATEMRSRSLFLEGSSKSKRRLTKPVQMYKDVVEAHKKFLYRQRLKEERPELYAQMRARDTYAKSIRRMMMKTGSCTNSGMFSNCYQWVNIPENKEYDSSIVLKSLHETEHI